MWNKTLTTMAFIATLSACDSDDKDNETTALKKVTINFAAKVGELPISCKLMENITVGQANTQPEFTDARLYISELALLSEEGEVINVELTQDGAWQYLNVALLDFETGDGTCGNGTAETNFSVKGTVPEGSYTGLKFTLGVPTELNNFGIDGDDSVSPLDVTGMNWSWQNGHKHLRMDIKGWNIHLGTTGCELIDANEETVNCANARPNRPQYQFSHFNTETNTVVFDYQALVANSDVSVNAPDTATGCMSSGADSDCQGVFSALGLDIKAGTCIGDDCSSAQTWLRVE